MKITINFPDLHNIHMINYLIRIYMIYMIYPDVLHASCTSAEAEAFAEIYRKGAPADMFGVETRATVKTLKQIVGTWN